MFTRRDFLRTSTMTAAASVAGVAGAPKFVFAQEAGQKTIIKVFMRGGADGLHLFPKVGDLNYYTIRPNIGIEPPSGDANSAIDLGGLARALNPNLAPMMEIWENGGLLISPATAIEEGNRSHFDCQRWIGTGQRNNIIDGYLNRYLQTIDATDHPLRGAVLGKSSLSTEMRGPISVPTISDNSAFRVQNSDFCSGSGCAENRLTERLAEISSHDVDLGTIEGQVREQQIVMLSAIDEVQAAGTDYTPSADGLNYNNSDLGRGLRMVAQLLKSGVPLSVASLDWNIGWDTHSNQIADSDNPIVDQDKSYNRNMARGASDFLCFWRDIAELRDDIVVLVGTEFGRTVKENGSIGTDHGHGGGWFAFGGPTVSMVADDVPSLADENLVSARYMQNLVDYRDLVGEIMVRHMGLPENMVAAVLPGHSFTNHNLFSAMS